MKTGRNFFAIGVIMALFFTACNKENDITLPETVVPSTELTLADILSPPNQEGNAIGFRSGQSPAIWSDCKPFGTIGTRTNFKPGAGKFDALFTGANFAEGLGAISESKPGDRDYNGGRWHVYRLKQGLDPDMYNTACRVEDLDLKDFTATDIYFECPLLPIR